MQNSNKNFRFDSSIYNFLSLSVLYKNHKRILLKTRIRNLKIHKSNILYL